MIRSNPSDPPRCAGRPRMPIIFEWNSKKASDNTRKHGVSFEEAATCFGDRNSQAIQDPDLSYDEDRYILLGMSAQSHILVVVHAERGKNIRIISARPANRRETAIYLRSH
jgi:hypothetical protein